MCEIIKKVLILLSESIKPSYLKDIADSNKN